MNAPLIPTHVEGFYDKLSSQGYSEDYDRQHATRIQWVIDQFKLNDLSNQRILDVGCGKGNFFSRMNSHAGNTFVGLDGAKLGPQGKLTDFLSIRVDLSQPFAHLFDNEERFDLIICSETLEHVAGIDNVLLEMKKLLKVNGHAIFTIPDVLVTHPVAFPGLFYPHQNFVIFIEQYAWLVEEQAYFDAGWQTRAFKVRNAPMREQKVIFPKDQKFWGQDPIAWTNL